MFNRTLLVALVVALTPAAGREARPQAPQQPSLPPSTAARLANRAFRYL